MLVLSMSKSAIDELYHLMRNAFLEARRIGDCQAPRKPVQIMYGAHELGRKL
jgi:hypothetical protein